MIQGDLRGVAEHFLRGDGAAAAGSSPRRSSTDPDVESLSSFIGVDGTNTDAELPAAS